MSEAGGGFHWGRANDFWRAMVRRDNSPEDAERIFREGDMTSLCLNTPEEMCLWADSQKFWAWSIGRRNAELREAAGGDFVMVPNWGCMSGIDHCQSRRVDAKNVRLWAPGTDLVFFEEDYQPGTLVPGYTLDTIVPYKYAASCGVRPCGLLYHDGGNHARTELATAEAPTWSGDGMFMQSGYEFPDIRRAYRAFYERHAEWYSGRSPHAQVGLLFSFDELHFENVHHQREVFSLARYLANHHVLFDLLNEAQLALDDLRRFGLVIVPHVQYLPRSARNALLAYLDEGGAVLVTGNTGAFDEHARPNTCDDALSHMRASVRSSEPFQREGRLAWIEDVREWFPARAWQIHDLMDYHVRYERLKETLIDELRAASENEPADDPRLADLLQDLADAPLPVLGPDAPPTLRAAAWVNPGDGSVVLHLLNYNVPGPAVPGDGVPGDGGAVPVENVTVSVPVRGHMAVSDVVQSNPWHPDPTPLDFDVVGSRVEFTVPRVDVSMLVRIG